MKRFFRNLYLRIVNRCIRCQHKKQNHDVCPHCMIDHRLCHECGKTDNHAKNYGGKYVQCQNCFNYIPPTAPLHFKDGKFICAFSKEILPAWAGGKR